MPGIKISFRKKIRKEIIHFVDDNIMISSKFRTVFFESKKGVEKVVLPEKFLFQIFGFFRIFRRLLRLDKCNVFYQNKGLVIIRQGAVYHYDLKSRKLQKTLTLRNCRNLLHQAISATPEGNMYFGEYGANKDRMTVPVYCSKDNGLSWDEIYTFPEKSIKHIHGCYYDKFTDNIWVCTGDFKGENYLVQINQDFKEVKKIGNGEQMFRACNLFFEENEVHWIMDSQLETSFHVIYNRETGAVSQGDNFLGPVWYIKRLNDGLFLATTAQENGEGVLDKKAHIYYSRDLKNWEVLQSFEHDGLPKKYFKNGIIGFADGPADSSKFYLFFEAIKGYDGASFECYLDI